MSVYIICPGGVATGGPEALHQLCSALLDQCIDAHMVYVPDGTTTHPDYKPYRIQVATDVPDDSANDVVVPEIWPQLGGLFRKARVFIWWLGSAEHGPIPDHVSHLAQCHYTKNVLESRGLARIKVLGDYIGDDHFVIDRESAPPTRLRQIAWNPERMSRRMEELMTAMPNEVWVPITGMSRQKVMETLKESRVFVDFGAHPGKDRLPREAAIHGCCVIVNDQGSAGNKLDCPIDDGYRIKDSQALEDAMELIQECLDFYETHAEDFDSYRSHIAQEADVLIKQAKDIFTRKIDG